MLRLIDPIFQLKAVTMNSVDLPNTSNETTGVIKFGGNVFVHNYTNEDTLAGELANNGEDDAYNTFVGVFSGNMSSTGSPGTALGGRNVGVGYKTGRSITTGWQNTFVGYIAGCATTSGVYNTALGAYALVLNSIGDYNTALGADALWKNETGCNNVAIGAYPLQQNISGTNNTAIGKYCLYQAEAASGNTAVGPHAMFSHETGDDNVAIGVDALRESTGGSNNMAIGSRSLYKNKVGTKNMAIGPYALFECLGYENVGVGFAAGQHVTTGRNNTLIGQDAGTSVTTANNCIAIGSVDVPNEDGSMNIGDLIKGVGSSGTPKMGFFGSDAVEQPESIVSPTAGATVDAECRESVDQIIQTLKSLGLMKQ